jgi:hypothetical protein
MSSLAAGTWGSSRKFPRLSLSHGSHAHDHEIRFVEHHYGATAGPAALQASAPVKAARSDRAVILGLLTLLTFSPCDGFLPVYLGNLVRLDRLCHPERAAGLGDDRRHGRLHVADLVRDRPLRLGLLERYESGALGALILSLGVGIIFLGF